MATVRKVRWGVLSTAGIGVNKVLPAMMSRSEHCVVNAIASRDVERAREAAKKLAIPKAYGSYEELLADPEIDAIYNPLPNHLHVPWTIKALQAGKHVLCEKPIALDANEARSLLAMTEAHPRLKVMEAFMYHHHPQWRRAKELVASKAIGELRSIQSVFAYFNNDASNIRNQAAIGGGGLMDIGCYNISLSRFLFDKEPHRVIGIMDIDPEFKTDRLASGILDFGSGLTSTFTCATQLFGFQRVNIFGAQGRIEIEIPFNAPPDRPSKMWCHKASNIDEITLPIVDQFALQGDAMSLAILNDTPVPTPLTDAVANMVVIDAMSTSSREERWVTIK